MIIDDIEGLTSGSGKYVQVECENCKEKRMVQYRYAISSWKKFGETYCAICRAKTTKSFLGKTHSDESRAKMSAALSGENHPFWGIKRTEWAKKFSGENSFSYGLIRSDETKEKIRKTKIGIKLSQAHKDAIGNAHRGVKKTRKRKSESERKSTLYEQIRKCEKYKQWRMEIYKRDWFTCVDCGNDTNVKEFKLNADHIKPFALIIMENNITTVELAEKCDELWNLENGRTLCRTCHEKTNTWSSGTRKMLRKNS